MNNKEIKIYGTLLNQTIDRTISDNTHNDAIAFAYQLYDSRFNATPNAENFLDNINKRITAISYLNNVTTVENRDKSKGNPYMFVVKGNTNIDGNIDVDNLTVRKNAVINGSIDVHDNAHFHKNVTVDGDTNIEGDIIVEGDTFLHGDVNIDGNTTINGDTIIEGDTNIKGDITIEGDIHITQNLESPNITEMQNKIEQLQEQINSLKSLWSIDGGYITTGYPARAAGFYDSTL